MLQLKSPAFADHKPIPRRYTCEGEGVSPPLEWAGVPPKAQSLVLIVDDPDAPDPAAPRTTWVHWVVYDIPVDSAALPEDVRQMGLRPGCREGLNDWHRVGYGGPCPPIGRHRYFFKLYAIDRTLGALRKPTKSAVLAAIEGHVLAQAQLVGTYQKE